MKNYYILLRRKGTLYTKKTKKAKCVDQILRPAGLLKHISEEKREKQEGRKKM